MQTSVIQVTEDMIEPVKKIGRPTKFTQEVLDKLRNAYLINATDGQACLQAGITEDALYKYQQRHPEFVSLKNAWKQDLAFKAKYSLSKHIPRDGDLALRVLERVEKDNWSLRTEHTGESGQPITFTWAKPQLDS